MGLELREMERTGWRRPLGIGVVTATSSALHSPPPALGREGHVGNRVAERRARVCVRVCVHVGYHFESGCCPASVNGKPDEWGCRGTCLVAGGSWLAKLLIGAVEGPTLSPIPSALAFLLGQLPLGLAPTTRKPWPCSGAQARFHGHPG